MDTSSQKRKEKALSLFREGFMCSQAICASFCDVGGLDEAMALRMTAGFGGGIARLGKTCGAVSAAVMIIGLISGHERTDDSEAKERTRALVLELTSKFEARHGSIACRDLLDIDISYEEGHTRAKELGLFDSRCPEFIATTAEILEEIVKRTLP